MKEVTENELAKQESEDNTNWQEIIDIYLENPLAFENEALTIFTFIKEQKLYRIGMCLTTVMMKLHTNIGYQTGKMITYKDIMKRNESVEGEKNEEHDL